MPDTIESLIKLFADDTKVFRAIESLDDMDIIQQDIDKLHAWSKKWQLPFNVSKCKVLHFGKNNNKKVYKMNNTDLVSESSEKLRVPYVNIKCYSASHIFLAKNCTILR